MIEAAYGCIAEAERAFLESGDRAAFECLVMHYMDGLIAFVCRTTDDFQLAEDVAQECFAELWVNRGRFRKSSSLKTYLYAMGHNIACCSLRKGEQASSVDNMDLYHLGADPVAEELIKGERDKRLWAALVSLRSPDREVIYLRYFEQMSYEEIGRILKLTTKKLYKTAERAKRSLAMDIEI